MSFEGFTFFELWRPSCSMAQNSLSNFGRELPKEPSCEIISKSVNPFSRRSRLKLFFLFIALVAILFNGAEPFEQFWLSGSQETFLCNYFKICSPV